MFQNTSDSSEITSTFIGVLRMAYLDGQGDGTWNELSVMGKRHACGWYKQVEVNE
jgi:hypothetical protein